MTAAELAGGIALAAAAAGCFDGAVALQALEARSLREQGVAPGLLRGLLARPRWLAATGLAVVGWPLQIATLALAPLTLVQPALALGLILLLAFGSRLLGERVRSRDLVAVAAIAWGLALLAWAAPENGRVHAEPAVLAIVLGGLGVVAFAPRLAPGRLPGVGLVAAAGCAYAASGLTSKLLADDLDLGRWGAVAGWGVLTGAVAALALADEMGALQRVRAARVAAGAFALQTAVPVTLAPLLAGEHWRPPLPITAGLVLVIGGPLALGAARAVSGLLADSHG